MRGCAPAPQLGRDGQLKLQENPKGWAKEPEWRTIRISINKSKTTADRINPWFTVVFKISRCQRRDFRKEKTNDKFRKITDNKADRPAGMKKADNPVSMHRFVSFSLHAFRSAAANTAAAAPVRAIPAIRYTKISRFVVP